MMGVRGCFEKFSYDDEMTETRAASQRWSVNIIVKVCEVTRVHVRGHVRSSA
jgi:hypothetical protein